MAVWTFLESAIGIHWTPRYEKRGENIRSTSVLYYTRARERGFPRGGCDFSSLFLTLSPLPSKIFFRPPPSGP